MLEQGQIKTEKVPSNTVLKGVTWKLAVQLLTGEVIKGASTKGLVFASKHLSWFMTLCQTSLREFSVSSKCKIAKNSGISPSTVHNIVKRSRQSGEILVQKSQGQKQLLNACDPQGILRRYCLRNCHATMMDIAIWAWEYFKIIVTQHSPPLHQEMQLVIMLN